ncbi:MAG: DNA polymerase III subunit delta' [Oscillibacter sp.]|nr:DNA polymerase III subunit delta' [Oscillibacter sp.]
MSTFSLSGQAQAEESLRAAAARNALSHAILITGGTDALSVARFAAAALECTGESGRPCGACRNCRKVAQDIHPDVITVHDPEHKNIAVDIIRNIRADAYVRPNEGQRKVYIFPDCSILPEQGQNVLLKIVEEGPPYAAFLFCADSPADVLQTLRSRCVELKLRKDGTGPAEAPEETEALCRAVASKRRDKLVGLTVRLEKRRITREELAATLAGAREVFAAALMLHYGAAKSGKYRELAENVAKNLTKVQIMRTIELFEKYHGECSYNVGSGHVLGALAAELEGIL